MSEAINTSGKSQADKLKLLGLALKKKGIAVSRAATIARRGVATTDCQLSYAQQRLWLLDQLNPGDPTYNMATALRLTGRLDIGALRGALAQIVRRHEVLRTTFANVGGEPRQRIREQMKVMLPVVDVSGLEADERERAAHLLARAEARRQFDLNSAEPLLRVAIVRLSEEEHIALFTMHHIITDGWSMGVLVGEVRTLYQAFMAGEESPLRELAVQYADYAEWQREYVQGEVLEGQLAYWRGQLSGAAAVLELPTDRARPNVQTHRGHRLVSRLNADLSRRLKALSQREGATLFMTLLAGFQTLLYRYSEQEQISVGVPVAGRTLPETEELIGLFLNTLVMRTDLSGDPEFGELLSRVREVCLGAYAHQDVPFEMLVEELQPARSLSHSPFFQVMFNLLNTSEQRIELTGLSTEGLSSAQHDAKFDLTLYASERGHEIQLTLNYNVDLFEEATVRAMLNHLQTLLEAAAANPQQRLSKLPLLSPDERRRLSLRPHGVRPIQPFIEFEKEEIEQSIVSCFKRRVRDFREHIAVETKTCRWTYRELDELTGWMAQALLAKTPNSGPERVALLFEHDAAMIAGIMAALKAGQTYVPLDPLYPLERITYILDDSQASAILTNARNLALAKRLSGGTRRVINIEALDFSTPLNDASPAEMSPDAIAYILYTSGSTGRPKGAMQTHRGILHHIRNYTNNLHISARDHLTLLSSYSFDAAVMDIFGALLNGATLCPFDVRDEGFEALPGWLVERRVTIYHSTPTLYRFFTNGLKDEDNFTGIRLVVLGGEEVFKRDVELYRKHFPPGCIFVNGLGPTESTVTLQHFIGRETQIAGNSVPVGYPVEDTEVLLLNAAGDEVEGFGNGEIAIKSDYLATGYWRQPELTRAAFQPDDAGSNKRIYRTGDVGRRLADGSLLFVGRRDRQVKIRGYRVELGEIEAVLAGHPNVGEAAVVARDDDDERRLDAYYVAKREPAPDAVELREYVKERLPEYMIPAAWVSMKELPLTSSGKVDRRLLPVASVERANTQQFVAPQTAVEEIVAGVWQELLRVGEVSAGDNFFDLGGHSLLAAQSVSRLRDALGVEIPLRTIFEHSTVAALARHLDARLGGGSKALRIARRGVATTDCQLSYAQQRLWLLDQLNPGDPTYNMATALRLTGRLDIGALRGALEQIVRRHEVLRTTFANVGGEPRQRIRAQLKVMLPVVDVSGLEADERERAAHVLAQQEARRTFDLEAGPLVRATLVRLSEQEHIALFTMHHIISDGWSVSVFVREFSVLYQAFMAGEESPLGELAIQYADYAEWQREYVQGEVLEGQLAYWRGQLSGAAAVLELPTDRARPNVQTHGGHRLALRVNRELTDSLKALAQREGATLFMTLLAAFQTLLARDTGQTDVIVGAPVAGRTLRETEDLIGFFINTLVMRTDLSGDPEFGELLSRVREVCLGAYAHQDVPFEMLVEELQPARSLSHSPLFQVTLTLQNAPSEALDLPGLKLDSFKTETESAKFDLSMLVSEGEQGLAVTLIYNTDLFDPATIRRMLGHFERLLAGIVTDPGRRISELPLLRAAEERQLLVEWNETRQAYPRQCCVQQLFEEQVAMRGEQTALVFGAERLSYRELNERANQLAHYLRSFGVGPEITVGLCLERSIEMIVAVLGILKAGGAYLPLDPQYPLERLSYMMEDGAISLLLTQESLLETLPAHWAHAVCLDSEWELIASSSAENLPTVASPDNLAYVSYTSGSTGRPKGVGVLHRNVVRLVKNNPYADFNAEQVFLQLAPLSFDASTFEIWGALLNGAQLVVMSAGVPTLEELGGALTRHGITTLWLTAGLFHLMVDERLADLAGLRQLLAGGDVLSTRHVSRALAQLPGVEIINGYGPTETTTFACCYRIAQAEDAASVPIGRPIANTQVYVLDTRMRPVGVGVAGELYIGGDGVTRGYLNGQELTAERFVPDAFGGEPGARLYRTGDLARYLADGRIEFIGRRDQQVKIRGFRIEPGEVESALRTHGAVRECVVLAREDEPGNKQLVAYVVAASGSQPSASELRDHLRQRLPEYCIPSAVIVLDELPLTSNGKVNRHALPAPNDVRDESWSDYVAPRTPAEEMLAGIWAEVLRVERVGVSDNFFDLGGHSLLATQLISRVREAFRIEIPLRQLFDAPALGDFAGAVEEMRGDGGSRAAPPLVRVSREQSLPLSFAQQRLWFLNQLEPRSAFYNVPLALKLSGRLDLHALERTLGEIVRRHEVLRTSFAVADGQPTQVVGPAAPVPLRLVDLSGMEREERARRAQEEIAAEAQQPFDLGRGPLLRALVVKLEDEEHAGVFTLHHIVSDGWSLGVLVREVATLYEAYMAGQESPFEELAVQYADYAYWQRHWLQGEVLERQLNYWKRQLRGAPALLDLPTDRPRPPMQTHHGARRSFALSLDLTNSLKALSRHQGTTLYMTLLAAFQTLLSRYSGQQDISVGSPIANRHRGETETLIGFFVNTLVLRTELSGDPRFTELLARVREVCLGAYSHQDVPFERLIEELQPERSLSHSPLFQVMFALQNAPSEVLELPGLRLNPFSARTLTAKFELTLSLAESPEGLVGAVEYNTDLFDDDTIARMMRHFERLLEGIVIEPEQRLSELPLLTNDERQQLLIEWNDTEADFPTNICLHELFEQQAARTPEHIAVIFEDQRLTYQQLNERASQLARHLHGLGVGPEVRVAIMVERSVEMVLAVLAVLKAGGAYVPLDPAYPSERLRFMLEDSQARVLLTKSHLAGLLDAGSAQVVWMDAEGAQSARTLAGQAASSSVAPSAGTVAENLAYVIYTSGSTGTPKGVAITHRSAAALLSWAYTRFSAESLAVVLASTSLCFDLSIFELFAPLCSGGTCLVVNDALQLPVLGGESGVTLINTVPSAMAELVRADALPASVQVVNLAGEALTAQLASNVYAVQPAVREVFNLYGPTEDTTYSTWALVERAGAEGREPAIGRPVANTRAYVLDERMEVVAEGVRGELYLSGEGLARGYLNRPELTAARFVPDPFAREPGGRLYRTGDVVRWHKQQLYYVGRADAQVKVRGFRIELGEVESALREHEGVDEACVVLREAAGGDDKRLVAYLVGRGEQRPEVSELRAFLQGKLPDYMVPSQFVTLAALPLTPNGKVDRRALPAPDSSRSVLSAHSVAPRTAAEQVVASIFARVLGVGEVGVTDNFFELGGHSLLATRVMSRVGKVFQVGVALRQLFEWPTVEGVVAALGQQWGDSVVVEDIAQTFIEVGGMSGENVEVMLAQMKTSARN